MILRNRDIGKHDGDCSIYASLDNIGVPEAGICTCGSGHKHLRKTGGSEHLYSRELRLKILRKSRSDTTPEMRRKSKEAMDKFFGYQV